MPRAVSTSRPAEPWATACPPTCRDGTCALLGHHRRTHTSACTPRPHLAPGARGCRRRRVGSMRRPWSVIFPSSTQSTGGNPYCRGTATRPAARPPRSPPQSRRPRRGEHPSRLFVASTRSDAGITATLQLTTAPPASRNGRLIVACAVEGQRHGDVPMVCRCSARRSAGRSPGPRRDRGKCLGTVRLSVLAPRRRVRRGPATCPGWAEALSSSAGTPAGRR